MSCVAQCNIKYRSVVRSLIFHVSLVYGEIIVCTVLVYSLYKVKIRDYFIAEIFL